MELEGKREGGRRRKRNARVFWRHRYNLCREQDNRWCRPPLNKLVSSCVSCTCALVPSRFMTAALLSVSSFKTWDGSSCSLQLFWKYDQHTWQYINKLNNMADGWLEACNFKGAAWPRLVSFYHLSFDYVTTVHYV